MASPITKFARLAGPVAAVNIQAAVVIHPIYAAQNPDYRLE
jgi:hypothetical protein